jgi:archaellum component FlaF (FlaF/FlaG flagellin family)
MEIGFFAAFLAWGFLAGASKGWRGVVMLVAVLVCILFLHSRLIGVYERIGRAVPIKASRVVVRFREGVPAPMRAARLLFFVAVAIMLFFGFGPVADSTARRGIVGCVFGLIAVAALNIALERHYVRIGRANESDVSSATTSQKREG